MNEVKKFIVGSEKIPEWLNEQCSKGRAKINYDEGKVVSIIVFSPTKTFTALKGDVIVLYKSGLSVITSDKAVKYGVKNPEVKNSVEKEKK